MKLFNVETPVICSYKSRCCESLYLSDLRLAVKEIQELTESEPDRNSELDAFLPAESGSEMK